MGHPKERGHGGMGPERNGEPWEWGTCGQQETLSNGALIEMSPIGTEPHGHPQNGGGVGGVTGPRGGAQPQLCSGGVPTTGQSVGRGVSHPGSAHGHMRGGGL